METTDRAPHSSADEAAASVRQPTMRAAVYHRFGGPDVVGIERMPRPEPRDGELLVRVHAASVSIADHRVRARDVPRGLRVPTMIALGIRRPKHPVLGMDAAGVVEKVGADVSGFHPGDRVVLLRGARFGCHAEYATVSAAGAVARIPDELSFLDAAALPFGFGTAATFLDAGGVVAGREVLVNGGSGAVGSAAVQLAKQRGATVTAVTSAGNADFLRELGADHVIDYAREDFTASRRRFDVVVECVGNAPYRRSARALRRGGVVLLVIADLAGVLGAKLRPVRGGIRRIQDAGAVTGAHLEDFVRMAGSGAIRPVIDRVYDLEAIREAHAYVDTGRKRGNVMLTIGDVTA
jgi:NADPH:quinone reductase-like Zn-dependent oxidoreductase